MKTVIGIVIKNKYLVGAFVVLLLTILLYWYALVSKIGSLENDVLSKTKLLTECNQSYEIEHATVESLLNKIQEDKLQTKKMKEEFDRVNKEITKEIKDIINQSNKKKKEGAKTVEELNQWLDRLF